MPRYRRVTPLPELALSDKQITVLRILHDAHTADGHEAGIPAWRVADSIPLDLRISLWSGDWSWRRIERAASVLLTRLAQEDLVDWSEYKYTEYPYSVFRRWRVSDRGRQVLGIAGTQSA